MRPGLLCPGKGPFTPPQPGPLAGFNEAGAVMPRKRKRKARRRTANAAGFNEAGAVMPRKRALQQPRRQIR